MLLFNNFQTSRIFWKKNKNKNVQYAILVHLTFLVLTFLLPFLKNWSNKLNFYWHWCFLNYLLQNPKYISKLKPHSRQKFHNQFEPILSNKNLSVCLAVHRQDDCRWLSWLPAWVNDSYALVPRVTHMPFQLSIHWTFGDIFFVCLFNITHMDMKTSVDER